MIGLFLDLLSGAAIGYVGAQLVWLSVQRYRRSRPVVVNGMQIPPPLVRAMWQHGSDWAPREGGSPFGSRHMRHVQILVFPESVEGSPARLQQWYSRAAGRFTAGEDTWSLDPDFLPAITDFSRIVECGMVTGNSLCLDYRESPAEPSVILWNGVYWRRVAPDAASLLAQLEPWDDRRHPLPTRAEADEADAVLNAVRVAAAYDVWDHPVMIHLMYRSTRELVVVFLPMCDASPSERKVQKGWRIRVAFPPAAPTASLLPWQAEGQAATTGDLQVLDLASPRRELGRAAALVLQHLASRSGWLPQSIYLRVSFAPSAEDPHRTYCVTGNSLPEPIGGEIRFWVSEDLTDVIQA